VSALLAVALALLAGLYACLALLRGGDDELPHELDRALLEGRLTAEAAAHWDWSRAAGELEEPAGPTAEAEVPERGERG